MVGTNEAVVVNRPRTLAGVSLSDARAEINSAVAPAGGAGCERLLTDAWTIPKLTCERTRVTGPSENSNASGAHRHSGENV